MREKSANTLELPKILSRLADYASFSAGAEYARALQPVYRIETVRERLAETAEARTLFEEKTHISIGGARDVREAARRARHVVILEPSTFLDIKNTLQAGDSLRRTLTRLSNQYPLLARRAEFIEPCRALVDEINRVFDKNGNIMDSASHALGRIRSELKVAFERLQSKLDNIVNSSANSPYLQETLITQRNGRYVIPIKAEFKGRIEGIVHDQSSSGATLFIEPISTVELNNTYREWQLKEEDEIRRILTELTQLVGDEADFIIQTVEIVAELDLIFARARYAKDMKASAPELVDFQEAGTSSPNASSLNPGSTIHLTGARHPLLDPETVVPIDVELDRETFVMVITGPNTGGKTVTLKTVGLLCLMAYCGLHIPAEPGAQISVFSGIYADIGDEQSIEQSLSTFSSHMTNIIAILEQADSRSLVLLDEVGAGTDPTEGAALAMSLLSRLRESAITTLVTTHHPELKVWSHEADGVINASVEFDIETLRPTYHLMIGLPGRSNALAIASRLGLPENVIENARAMLGQDELDADNLLESIYNIRDTTQRKYEETLASQEEVEDLRAELRDRLDSIEEERQELLRKARAEAAEEVEQFREELRDLRQRMHASGMSISAVADVERDVDEIEDEVKRPIRRAAPQAETYKFQVGDHVKVRSIGVFGDVYELNEDDAEIQVGKLRIRAAIDDLEKVSNRQEKESQRQKFQQERNSRRMQVQHQSPGMEIDIRGNRVEEAEPKIHNYIESAFLAGVPFARIIHGKGTGALRRAIRDMLRDHPLVDSYERGLPGEGGDGVTVVKLSARR